MQSVGFRDSDSGSHGQCGQVFRVWGLELKVSGFRVEGVLKLSLRQSSLDKHT